MNYNVTRRVASRAAASAHCRRWASSNSSRKLGPKPKAKAPPSTLLYKPTSEPPPRAREQAAQPPPPPREADTLLTVWRSAWLPLSGAALAAGAIGFYIFGTAAATFKGGPCACEDDHAAPTGRPPALTGDNAEQFDKELNWPEWWMGITSLRRKLAEHATGDVLELAMGSGRNLEYYDWSPITDALEAAAAAAAAATAATETNDEKKTTMKKRSAKTAARGITSFTGLDISVDMLDVARKKLTQTVPPLKSSEPIVRASSMADNTGGQLAFLEGRLRLVHSDAHHALPAAPSFHPPPSPPPSSTRTAAAENKKSGSNTDANKKYDSIIQTFGLCSVSDPVAVLTNLASAVKPGTGRIVLLEHGKGFYGLVNGLLDKNAGKHFDKYGCWWNRDIEALVEEAARQAPGLSIVKVERPKVLQMGTLVWVELKVDETPSTSNK